MGGCNVGQLLKIYAIRKLSENVFGENGLFSFKGRIKDFLKSLSVMFFSERKSRKRDQLMKDSRLVPTGAYYEERIKPEDKRYRDNLSHSLFQEEKPILFQSYCQPLADPFVIV